jgi:hypothetical protein
MRKVAVGIIIALLVAAGLGVGYLAENPSRQVASTSSTTTRENPFASSATSTVSPTGLELRIDLNSTRIQSGGTLAANVTLFNTLNSSLSMDYFYPPNFSSWDNHDFVCAASGVLGLASFALIKGHFSAGNLSQAPAPLQVAALADLPCVSFMPSAGEQVTFSPHSSEVVVPGALTLQATLNVTTVSCIALPRGSSQCHGNVGLFGYWVAGTGAICCPGSSDNSQYFRYFTPGAYTLVAEDLLEQTVYAYFQVTQGPSPEVLSAEESPLAIPAPLIGLTLANFANVPVSSLNATLRLVPSNSSASPAALPFTFGVNSSSPLSPGQTVEDVEALQGGALGIGVSYPLTISGAYTNGTGFTYTQQVQFVNSVPSW